eukprot:Lithocolla_globosa_v1_NODE_3416_length_1677_cov_44.881628.p3 type:complete len:127 gc:universal NODE_3416_length_1677_cov_44.881628:694-1074(+)
MIAHASPPGTKGTDAMGLVNVEVELVFFLEGDDCWQVENGAFHRIKPFNNNEDLGERPMSSWVSLGDALAQALLQIRNVVVLKDTDASATVACSDHKRRVVQLITDHQRSLANEGRESSRICCKTH